MNSEYRRGWRAACAAVAKSLRVEVAVYTAVGSDVGNHVAATVDRIARDVEAMQPPGTLTVVDEEGKRLL